MIEFDYKGVSPALSGRRLLCRDLSETHTAALASFDLGRRPMWRVVLGENLLFDRAGLKTLESAILGYRGQASRLDFVLRPSEDALRDYFSHHPFLRDGAISLPITANRLEDLECAGSSEVIEISIPELRTPIAFPVSLAQAAVSAIPLGLLFPVESDHDLLLANQIAVISEIAQKVRTSPLAWCRALMVRSTSSWRKRLSLAWRQIHPHAEVHPTAVVEGSIIGKGCRIGAHCVVRYSVIGENVILHDGAKVEFSCVDDGTWLMHDLVLYRSVTEPQVFLIHGPYQFSYFQRRSAAFACIMMDYRPDARPIQMATRQGLRSYRGRFLGAVLQEDAKVFGGTITSPGITIPAGRHIYADAQHICRAKDLMSAEPVGA